MQPGEPIEQRVDSHCHLWDLDRGDYGWLDRSDPALAPIARNFCPADLNTVVTPFAISQVVAVQAAPTVDETRYLLDLAAGSTLISGVVGWVDLTSKDAARDLEELGLNAKFKGIRPMLQDIEDADWIITAPRKDAIAALLQTGRRFDALVLPQHLEALLTFAHANPDLPIVIDHAAKPALTADAGDPRHGMWREGMRRMADDTTAYCKLSGLLTEMSALQRRNPLGILQSVFDDLMEWFGPERLMWGSDWPVLTLAAPFQDWHSISGDLLSRLAPRDRARIQSGSALAFYGLEAAA